jgi:hypothetical protein
MSIYDSDFKIEYGICTYNSQYTEDLRKYYKLKNYLNLSSKEIQSIKDKYTELCVRYYDGEYDDLYLCEDCLRELLAKLIKEKEGR